MQSQAGELGSCPCTRSTAIGYRSYEMTDDSLEEKVYNNKKVFLPLS